MYNNIVGGNDMLNNYKELVILAEEGNEAAIKELWLRLDQGVDICNTTEWDYRWYLVVAEKYQATEAMLALYWIYKLGIYVERDYDTASYWLNKAVSNNDTEALKILIINEYRNGNYIEVINRYRQLELMLKEFDDYEEMLDDAFDLFGDELTAWILSNN